MTDRLPVRAIDATGLVGDGSKVLHDNGTWAAPSGGGVGGGSGAGTPSVVKQRTSGNLSFSSTTWAAVDAAMDLTLSGMEVGDVVELSLTLRSLTVNNYLLFDVRSRVAGADVRRWDAAGTTPTTGDGFPGWMHAANNTEQVTHSPMLWTVTAADIASDGTVTFRLYARTSTATTPVRTVYSSAQVPVVFSAKNLSSNSSTGGVGDIDGGSPDSTYFDFIDGGTP